MAENHAKGPWKLFYIGEITDVDGKNIVNLPFDSYREFSECSEQVKANYRLMTAAPQLLAALKAMTALHERHMMDGAQELGELGFDGSTSMTDFAHKLRADALAAAGAA